MEFLKYIIAVTVSVIIGCSGGEKKERTVFTESSLRSLVEKAAAGDSSANKSLSGLIDFTLPINTGYNQLTIIPFLDESKKQMFAVVLEYPNPVYNRLAIYNQTLNAYLIDKSLSGNLSPEIITVRDKHFLKLTEDFISKGALELQRVSLYGVNSKTAGLMFRSFTRLKEPSVDFSQDITSITPEKISTIISSSQKFDLKFKEDSFLFDDISNTYISNDNKFDNFVIERVKQFNTSQNVPEITNPESALLSVGLNPAEIKSEGDAKTGSEVFSIKLNEDWKEIKDFTLTKHLKSHIKGVQYVNDKIGANISIALIPVENSAEDYIDHSFGNSAQGIYNVRFSNRIDAGKNTVRFFEYSCSNIKLIMIFEFSKYTFEEYKEMYEEIINTLFIDC